MSCSFIILLLVVPAIATIEEDDIIIYPRQKKSRGEPAMTWPEGKVFYTLAEGEFSRLQAASLSRNLMRLESVSCVRFLPAGDSQESYLRFRNLRHRCASSIGYRPKKVLDLYVGWPECHRTGIMQHELLHGLGMWHEHSRHDRDQYVTVFWENITKGKEFNFRLGPWDKTLSLPYDYTSVLHYRARAFSKTGNEITLLPKDYSALRVMGQRRGVTAVDIAKLNRLYNCSEPYYTGDDLEGVPYISKIPKKRFQELPQWYQNKPYVPIVTAQEIN